MIDDPKMPNPGSAEAVAAGCTCAVLDNCRGAGAYVREDGSLEFWITQGCPIHAPEVKDGAAE
jgi:hypothetical protein